MKIYLQYAFVVQSLTPPTTLHSRLRVEQEKLTRNEMQLPMSLHGGQGDVDTSDASCFTTPLGASHHKPWKLDILTLPSHSSSATTSFHHGEPKRRSPSPNTTTHPASSSSPSSISVPSTISRQPRISHQLHLNDSSRGGSTNRLPVISGNRLRSRSPIQTHRSSGICNSNCEPIVDCLQHESHSVSTSTQGSHGRSRSQGINTGAYRGCDTAV